MATGTVNSVVANDPSGVPAAPPEYAGLPGQGGSVRVDTLSYHARGINMETEINKHINLNLNIADTPKEVEREDMTRKEEQEKDIPRGSSIVRPKDVLRGEEDREPGKPCITSVEKVNINIDALWNGTKSKPQPELKGRESEPLQEKEGDKELDKSNGTPLTNVARRECGNEEDRTICEGLENRDEESDSSVMMVGEVLIPGIVVETTLNEGSQAQELMEIQHAGTESVKEAPLPQRKRRGRPPKSRSNAPSLPPMDKPPAWTVGCSNMASWLDGEGANSDSASSRIMVRETQPGGNKRRKRRRVLGSSDEEAIIDPLSIQQRIDVDKELKEVVDLPAASLATRGLEWLTEAEAARKKSPNIQGPLSRQIKLGIYKAQEVIMKLGSSARERGDPGYLKARIAELEKDREDMRLKVARLEEKLEELTRTSPKLDGVAVSPSSRPEMGETRMGDAKVKPMRGVPTPPQTPLRRPGANQGMVRKIGRDSERVPFRPERTARAAGEGDPVEALSREIARAIIGLFDPERKGIREYLPGATTSGAGIADENKAGPAGQNQGEACDPDGATEVPWSKVLGRRTARRRRREADGEMAGGGALMEEEMIWDPHLESLGPTTIHGSGGPGPGPKPETERKKVSNFKTTKDRVGGIKSILGRPPKTAAVAITCKTGGEATYAEVMKRAKEHIPLNALGIEATRVRRAVTGGLLIEIPGEDMGNKADVLAGKLRNLFDGEGDVKISRPIKKAEIRLFGLDDSVTQEEVKYIIATTGKCAEADIRVGKIRPSRSGLGSIWAQCPLEVAGTLARMEKVRIGWTMARVELLKRRTLQCFRCLAAGHTQYRCPNVEDRSKLCYNCGEEGHKVTDCGGKTSCPICKSLGRKYNHRAGSKECLPAHPMRKAMAKKDEMEIEPDREGKENTSGRRMIKRSRDEGSTGKS